MENQTPSLISIPFLLRVRGSLFNARFYRALGATSLRDGCVYLLKLILLLSFVQAGAFAIPMIQESLNFGDWAAESLPLVVIENGKVVTELDGPVVAEYDLLLEDEVSPRRDGEVHEKVAVVIDLEEEEFKADAFDRIGALLTRRELVYSGGVPESRGRVNLTEVVDLRLSDSFYRDWARRVAALIPFMLFGWIAAFMVVSKGLLAVLLGLVTAIGPGRTLKVDKRFVIVLHALTPAVLLDAVVSILGVGTSVDLGAGNTVEAWFFGYGFLVLYATFWAMKQAAEAQHRPVVDVTI